MTKLSRTLQLDGEWEVGQAEIDYPHTWYNIREGKKSVEIYVPDTWAQGFSTQPGYYEKVTDVIDPDTSKRVTVRCAKGAVLELRGIQQGCLDSLTIGRLEPYPKLAINIFTFIQISSRANIMVTLLFPFFVLLQ